MRGWADFPRASTATTSTARGGDGPVWRGASSVITHFQSGHGWAFNSALTGTTSSLNDASEVGLGSQAVKVVTAGPSGTYQHVLKTGAAAVDLTGKKLRVWLKTTDMTKMGSTILQAAPTGGIAGGSYFSWNLMTSAAGTASTYGASLPPGEWVAVDLSFADAVATGAPARTAITEWKFIVSDQGGTPATLWLGGIDVLPTGLTKFGTNGVVVMCFDDGYVSQWTYARQRLATYGFQATFLPIVDLVGTASGMTVAQLREMQDTYGHEIGGHSYAVSNHDNFNALPLDAAEADMRANFDWLGANGFHSRSYAYPLGAFLPYRQGAKRQWRCARTIDTMTGALSHTATPPNDFWRLRSISSVGGTGGASAASLTTAGTGKIAKCKAENSLLVMTFHRIVAGASASALECSDTDLGAIIDSCAAQGVAVATLGQVAAATMA